ncbi:unnamed protein product [Rhizophagus irregularis]|nr:unnamed protein product [Rhizophagus irregularis]CAB5375594.1 unnamed protein product [Rhizophagus irregularis]
MNYILRKEVKSTFFYHYLQKVKSNCYFSRFIKSSDDTITDDSSNETLNDVKNDKDNGIDKDNNDDITDDPSNKTSNGTTLLKMAIIL